MLNKLKIEVFLDVCETLNFTKTAERLYLSQQGVSRHIADLENELGVRLFDRGPHRMGLTPAGEEARLLFQGFMDEFSAFRQKWRGADELVRAGNVLRVGYQDFLRFGTALRTGFKALAARIPGIRVEGQRGDPAQLLALLSSGEIDAAIMLSRFLERAEGVSITTLKPSKLMLYVMQDDPLNAQEGGYLKFKEAPLLINAFEGEDPKLALRRERKKMRVRGFTPSEYIVLNNRGSIYTEAYMGRGVFFGSAYADIPEDVPLVSYPTPFDDSFCFVHLKDSNDERLAVFGECLSASFSASQPPARAGYRLG